jgi:hypothetical protein
MVRAECPVRPGVDRPNEVLSEVRMDPIRHRSGGKTGGDEKRVRKDSAFRIRPVGLVFDWVDDDLVQQIEDYTLERCLDARPVKSTDDSTHFIEGVSLRGSEPFGLDDVERSVSRAIANEVASRRSA